MRNYYVYLILVFALLLRLTSLNQSFWLDEATTAQVAQSSLSDYFTKFAPGDFHPPLYYLLAKGVSVVLGSSEVAIRSLSVLAGVVTVWLVFLIGTTLVNRRAGAIAGLFLATSGLHIYYSQEARMYALATLLATASVYFFLSEKWKMFSVSIAAMIMTHYVTVFMLPVFWIYMTVTAKSREYLGKFLKSHVLLIIVGIFWLPVFIKQFSSGLGVESTSPLWWNILGRTTIKEIILVPAKFFFGRITIDNNLLYGLLVGFVGLIYSLIIFAQSPFSLRPFKLKVEDSSLAIWLWFIVPLSLTGVLGLWIPVFSYFRLLFVLPAFFILLSFGISRFSRPAVWIAVTFVLVINLVSSGIYLFNPRFQREDWRGLVEFVTGEASTSKSPVTLFVNNSQMEAYNYYLEGRQDYIGGCSEGFITVCRARSVPSIAVEGLSGGYDIIWLMRYVQPVFDPEDNVRMKVENLGYLKRSEHNFNGVVVWRYDKNY